MSIKKKAAAIAFAAAMLTALAAGIAAASSTSVTITSPKTGSSISLAKNPTTTVAGQTLVDTGPGADVVGP